MDEFDPNKATGMHLELIAADFGVRRRRKEKDSQLRLRLKAHALASARAVGTTTGIGRLAQEVAGPKVWVNIIEGPGRVELRVRGPLWRHALVIPAWLDRRRVRAAVEPQIAAGVILEIKP